MRRILLSQLETIEMFAGFGGYLESYWRDSYFIDNANLVKAPGYAVVNLGVHYQPPVAGWLHARRCDGRGANR